MGASDFHDLDLETDDEDRTFRGPCERATSVIFWRRRTIPTLEPESCDRLSGCSS